MKQELPLANIPPQIVDEQYDMNTATPLASIPISKLLIADVCDCGNILSINGYQLTNEHGERTYVCDDCFDKSKKGE